MPITGYLIIVYTCTVYTVLPRFFFGEGDFQGNIILLPRILVGETGLKGGGEGGSKFIMLPRFIGGETFLGRGGGISQGSTPFETPPPLLKLGFPHQKPAACTSRNNTLCQLSILLQYIYLNLSPLRYSV